jgi:hypothetical protein
MISIDAELDHQIKDLVVESHDWVIQLTDSSASPVTYVIHEKILDSLSGIDWTLEKDWSIFLTGDVAFTVHDFNGSLQTFLKEKTPPFKVNIHAKYTRTSCLCFTGYLKMGETQITDDEITLYAISLFGWIEQYTYKQTINTNPNKIVSLRHLLQDAIDPEGNPRGAQLYDVGITNLDCEFAALDRVGTQKGSLFDTRAVNQRIPSLYAFDVVKIGEDNEKYHLLICKIDVNSPYYLRIYRGYAYKTDPSLIVEETENIFNIWFFLPIKGLRILHAPPRTYPGRNEDYIILIDDSPLVDSEFRKIVIINKDLNDYFIWDFDGHIPDTFNGNMWGTGLDEMGDYLGFVTNVYNQHYRTYRVSLENLWSGGGITDYIESDEVNSIIDSADFTYDYNTGYYYLAVMEKNNETGRHDIALYRARIGIALVFVTRIFVFMAPIPSTLELAGSGRYFLIGGAGRHDFFDADATWFIFRANPPIDRTVSENMPVFPSFKNIIGVNESGDEIYTYFYWNYILNCRSFAYDTFASAIGPAPVLMNFRKIKVMNLDLSAQDDSISDLIIPLQKTYGFNLWLVLSKKLPMLIQVSDGTTPIANKILDGITCKEFIQQVVGCYLLTAHIHKDNSNQNTLVVRPRSGVYPYCISQDSIIMDSIEVGNLPDYQIELTSQSITKTYPEILDPTKETLSFTFNCLPVPLLLDIAYYLYQQFQNWIRKRIRFKADSLFFIEPSDWVRIQDGWTGIKYQGVIVKNLIGEDGICDMEILGKEV